MSGYLFFPFSFFFSSGFELGFFSILQITLKYYVEILETSNMIQKYCSRHEYPFFASEIFEKFRSKKKL